MLKKILFVIITVTYLLFWEFSPAYSAVHTLSEYKKLYPTFYILPADLQYLKEKPDDFILIGDIESHFNDDKEVRYLLETFNRLTKYLKDKGFVLVDSPEKADAIIAFRIQLAGYDVYHETARNASLRIIDVASHDTLMIIYTPGMDFLSLRRDIYDELKELLKTIDKNIESPYSAEKFAKKIREPKNLEYTTVEKEGLVVQAASLYKSGLSIKQFDMNLKDHNIVPVKVIIKNNSAQDIVLNSLSCQLKADNIEKRNALTSYEAMKIIGRYDAMAEGVLSGLLGGLVGLGLTDWEGWAPDNDKKEFAIVYSKFEPITRIKANEEVVGILLFDVSPQTEKKVTRTSPVKVENAELVLPIKKISGENIEIQINLNEP